MNLTGSTLILLAMIGQLPGADRPASPPAVVSMPGETPRTWLLAVSPIDGRHIRVYGWMEGGNVRYYPQENPQLYGGQAPPPAPELKVKPVPEPKAEPKAEPRVQARAMPTGVITEKLPHPPQGRAWYGGNTAAKVVGDGHLIARKPDVYLTVIGPEDKRKAVLRSLEADPAMRTVVSEMGDRLAIHDYDPSNPMAADVGLPAGGSPDVVIQDASGRELARHRSDPGAGRIVSEIRKADPNYKPGGSDGTVPGMPSWAWLAVGFLAVVAIAKAKGVT